MAQHNFLNTAQASIQTPDTGLTGLFFDIFGEPKYKDDAGVVHSFVTALSINTETPSGLINSSNVTYTTINTINAILNFAINGQYLHPTVDYTFTGNTITMTSPLDSSLLGLGFTIIYV